MEPINLQKYIDEHWEEIRKSKNGHQLLGPPRFRSRFNLYSGGTYKLNSSANSELVLMQMRGDAHIRCDGKATTLNTSHIGRMMAGKEFEMQLTGQDVCLTLYID